VGFVDKKVKSAVSSAMKDLEKKFVRIEREALEKNKKLMLEKLDGMEKIMKECVHTEVEKQLKGRV